MLKVVGIWDDGWATGVMIDERADEWDAKRNAQRDSGVSNTSGRRDDSPFLCIPSRPPWSKTQQLHKPKTTHISLSPIHACYVLDLRSASHPIAFTSTLPR